MMFAEWSSVGSVDPNGSGEHFKRAVLRPPPSRFTVEFLTPNYSSNHNHCMHISPLATADSVSVTSRVRNVEYTIWRKWEDCLWLQDTLEKEYSQAAREKKIRLQQGKGVKGFNGLYKTDMASSWESLPPGPDPQSVGQDVHSYLPKLNKRGTVFRPSKSIVDQRQKEFQNLVEALFSEDMPALIQEIRASNHVTDFFALWRRDFDIMEKSNKGNRNSVSHSVFSAYFSDSTQSLGSTPSTKSKSLPNSPASKASSTRSSRPSWSNSSSSSTRSSSTESASYSRSSRRHSGSSDDTTCAPRMRRRALSNASTSDSSSIHSDGSSDSGSTASTNPTIAGESPLAFGHNPQQASDRPASILEVLPEELEMLSKTSENYTSAVRRPRPRISSIERRTNRSYSIVQPPSVYDRDEDIMDDRSTIRHSWQSDASIDALTNDILNGLSVSLPHSIKEQKFRASIASISTFMTTDSAEAMFPREFDNDHEGRASPRENKPDRPRLSIPLSLSDFEIQTEDDAFDGDSIIDSFPRPSSYFYDSRQEGARSTTPTGHYAESAYTVSPESPRSTCSSLELPPSPTYSTASSAFTTSTTSTALAASGMISIKAAHNSSIIMIKVHRSLDFTDIRQRIYNKFVGQEGIPLSQSFKVAYVQGAPNSPIKGSGASSRSSGSKDRSSLEFIKCDTDWERLLMSTEGNKISLKILDAPQ